ncbi:MAG: spermidine synthase [Pseudomonadota bacterium]|nr:spermidine synthase [Pseudomonadota bacterium]
MKPRQLVGSAIVPGGGQELRLFRRGDDYMIVLDRNELMSSRMSGSEESLAELTCARLRGRNAPKLLIGGYGMGFTLRAALRVLPADASVVVAELVPEIIAWARGPMAALTSNCLDDPRVRIDERDVAALIAEARGTYDAILLDVDNGPDGLTHPGNERLYSIQGLAAAKAALSARGLLAIWSAAPDTAFTRRLIQSRFDVEEVTVRARSNDKGPRHTIWLAERE